MITQSVLTWVLVYAGVVFYFANKGRSLQLDAEAVGEEFNVLTYLKNEWVDILLAICIAFYVLTGNSLEGLTLDFSTKFACFTSGIVISYLGVNIVLRAISLLPGINVGNKSRKTTRKIVAEKK
jgi:hypothetical protein